MGALGQKSKKLALLILACAVIWITWGCSEPFPPDTLVDRLRILGVRAEPPDVFMDGTCTMDALVADPGGQGRTLSYTWAVCMVQITGVAKDFQCPGPDSYVFGDSASAILSVPELAAWALDKGFPMDPDKMPPGQDLDEIPLIVGLKVTAAGGDEVSAIKRVRLHLASDAEVNSNPTIVSLQKAGDTWSAHLGDTLSLIPIVSDDSREVYIPSGEDQEQTEDLVFSWFSTTGEFRDRWTVLDVSDQGEALEENEWIVSKDQDAIGQQKLWLVVRDGRWGIDWAEFGFSVEP